MTEKTTQLVLAALSRAASQPQGERLHGTKTMPGLFPGHATARDAADFCKRNDYLRVLRTETKGKKPVEICAITDKGIAFLLSQVSPRPVLEQLLQAVHERAGQLTELASEVHQCHVALRRIGELVAQALEQPPSPPSTPSANGTDLWKQKALGFLSTWRQHHPNEDCPLPELYRHLQGQSPSLSLGRFHDGLRQLHDQGQVHLHPWTGPLYEIPEPACALLVGHAVVYYASRKA